MLIKLGLNLITILGLLNAAPITQTSLLISTAWPSQAAINGDLLELTKTLAKVKKLIAIEERNTITFNRLFKNAQDHHINKDAQFWKSIADPTKEFLKNLKGQEHDLSMKIDLLTNESNIVRLSN
ncbi:hypothetical protein BC833DRAFT_592140 [Globomyces pollinis-pini]|nr:hypothetical protein BC833DRAFT_592140 [Globomyces pollinis-pini]